ncbi:MAG: hypothetical protein LBK95_16675 [Bifidobacteriaceae bacterium]|jgi:uncharacterized protein YukE|nr:hypothetical protein [Bifidobacteriaceae bacterium]
MVDTHIDGDVGARRDAAAWLRSTLTEALDPAVKTIRACIDSEDFFEGQTADAFRKRCREIQQQLKATLAACEDTGTRISLYADALEDAQAEAARVRQRAVWAGLTLVECDIRPPPAVKACPPSEWRQTNPDHYRFHMDAYNANAALWDAYRRAVSEWESLVDELAGESQLVARHGIELEALAVPALEQALGGGSRLVELHASRRRGGQIGRLRAAAAKRDIDAISHGRAWLPNSRLMDRAAKLTAEPSAGEVGGRVAGRVIGPAFTTYGVHSDIEAGESAAQAAVSQGLGMAGAAAGAMAGAKTGAVAGSILAPGVGSAVGGAIGGVLGGIVGGVEANDAIDQAWVAAAKNQEDIQKYRREPTALPAPAPIPPPPDD